MASESPRACQPLQGITVLDASLDTAGHYCAYLLGEAGAQVVGSPARGIDETSAGLLREFRARWAAVDDAVRPSERSDDFEVLVQSAKTPGELPYPRPDQLEQSGAGNIVCSITPFGLTGPYASFASSDFTVQALGGWVYHNGLPGCEPIQAPGLHAAATAAGVVAATTVMAYLVAGEGAEIDVSAAEAVLATNRYHDTFWSFRKEMPTRPGYGFSATNRVAQCRDGAVSIAASTQSQWEMLCVLMEMEDLLVDPRMQTPLDRLANTAEIGERMDSWLLAHERWDIFHRAQALRLPMGPILSVVEARNCDQFRARSVFIDERGNAAPLPTRMAVLEPCGRDNSADAPRPNLSLSRTARPLAGRRVVEVVSWWAGPIVGRIFALLGAEVVKVESPLRPDPWRYVYCDDENALLYETSPLFSAGNVGKLSVGIDSSAPTGRELLFDLISTSDILVENLSPAAADRLGLLGRELVKKCPGLVRLSVSGFGLTGPWRDYLSFAAIGDGVAGITAAMRYEVDGHSLYQGSVIGDSITGYHAAFYALAALYARDHHEGRGQLVDVAQCEALLSLMLATLAEPSHGANVAANACPRYLLQACMRTAGEDQWLAVSVEDESTLRAAVARLTDQETVPKGADDLRAALESDLLSWSKFDAFQALQEIGVAACPVLDPAEVLSDPHFRERSTHMYLEHPVTGRHPYVGLGAQANGQALTVTDSAPLFGEQTRAIIESLGFEEDLINEFFGAGVLSLHPFNDGPVVGA